ncbi:glycosyltransferase family 2 protein [Rubrolithibacter danxiaensis]|uniref:glycosyltransferase family 2 protein n=1 Tax=Rubrolithibacter danxiaensis TaxID=3390805 RepID=UPI003BF850E7
MILSICVPTYNRPDYLIEVIKSCFSVTEVPCEILIGDDSQLDNAKVVNEIEYPANFVVHYFHHKTPLKQNKNVDFLLQRVKGKYCVLMHDDDGFNNSGLLNLLEKAKELPPNIVVFGKQILIDENGKIDLASSNAANKDYCRSEEYAGLQEDSTITAINQSCPSNGFIFPGYLAKRIGYRSSEIVGNACDFDFVLRLALEEECGFYFINEFVSFYRMGHSAVSTNTNSALYFWKIIQEYRLDETYPDIISQKYLNQLNKWIGTAYRFRDLPLYKYLFYHKNYPFLRRFSLRGILDFFRFLNLIIK